MSITCDHQMDGYSLIEWMDVIMTSFSLAIDSNGKTDSFSAAPGKPGTSANLGRRKTLTMEVKKKTLSLDSRLPPAPEKLEA